ncbi:MAG: hypothetical protein ACTHU0_34295, partial [Kofleriaceae bacterium]
CLTDAAAPQLAQLPRLERLDVSESYLSSEGVAALDGVAETLVASAQRDADADYRVPVVGE